MSDPGNSEGEHTTVPVMVEDLFLTDAFLIKGRMGQKYHRLTKMLEDAGDDSFLPVYDAVMISLRSNDVVRTPCVQVNTREIILAHELVEIAGDQALRELAENKKSVRIRAFYSRGVQIELAGKVEPGAYFPMHGSGRRYFIMQDLVVRGLNLEGPSELRLLKNLSYAIVQKKNLSYVYDFS